MQCQVCGAASGKYPLCRECNKKKEEGKIFKCPKCGRWHYTEEPCPENSEQKEASENSEGKVPEKYLYDPRESLLTPTEKNYMKCIRSVLPENCLLQMQANLASFIVRTDGARFQTELFRNVDFLITDLEYRPLIVIEVNDSSHLSKDRQERDKKVAHICEEAGIPIIKLWTSYGINPEYIKNKIAQTLASLPVTRVHHFEQISNTVQAKVPSIEEKKGCYIATCVYGSYDCPSVWTLRRFRDQTLQKNWLGRAFIKVYYALSPQLVEWFGDNKQFRTFWKRWLDLLVKRLRRHGFEDAPYEDSFPV